MHPMTQSEHNKQHDRVALSMSTDRHDVYAVRHLARARAEIDEAEVRRGGQYMHPDDVPTHAEL